MKSPLVSTEWLMDHLSDPNLIILDASIPKVGANEEEKENIAIKGARFFDLKNKFSDKTIPLPNTFPGVEQFEKGCQELGINNHHQIVVYDSKGVYSSPRIWWMFRTMGHENVAVLDGGLPEWIRFGGETEPEENRDYEAGNFKARFDSDKVKDFQFVQNNLTNTEYCIIDARSAGRFNGTAPEPREGLRSGSIPNSVNLPYTEVLNEGKFKSVSELKVYFENLNIGDKNLVFSCGSGLTACIILLAAELATTNLTHVYDGSWTEWGQKTP